MTKPVPPVQKYMTALPHTIGQDQPLGVAERKMREEKIRHLPVLDGGKLVGVLTERDVQLVRGIRGFEPETAKVDDVMSEEPYAVTPEAPLDEVAEYMARKRLGSAVVMQNEKVVGIFTAVDALQAVSDLLRGRLRK